MIKQGVNIMNSKLIVRFKQNIVNKTFRVLIAIFMVIPVLLLVGCESLSDILYDFLQNVILFTDKNFPLQEKD